MSVKLLVLHMCLRAHGFALSRVAHAVTLQQRSRLVCSSMPGLAKQGLIDAIARFNVVRAQGGAVRVDFGVDGGELDQKSRAPVSLNMR